MRIVAVVIIVAHSSSESPDARDNLDAVLAGAASQFHHQFPDVLGLGNAGLDGRQEAETGPADLSTEPEERAQRAERLAQFQKGGLTGNNLSDGFWLYSGCGSGSIGGTRFNPR